MSYGYVVPAALYKQAHEALLPYRQQRRRSIGRVAAGTVGLGVGTLLGASGGFLADAISEKLTGHPIPYTKAKIIAPALIAGMGLAHSIWKAKEREEMDRAFKGH